MSPANVYRFFSSRRAIEEAIVAELLAKVSLAAENAARRAGSAAERLCATLHTVAQMHHDRVTNEPGLNELIDAAVRGNWPVTLSHADCIRGIVRAIIAAGQVAGEFGPGSPMALACCLIEAMDCYLCPPRITPSTVRPTFDDMLTFGVAALRNAAPAQATGTWSDVHGRAAS